MADTGATVVALTYEDAERLGLSPRSLDFSSLVQTANGIARVAPVKLDRVRIDDIMLRDVPAIVAERGALATNLLGMSFLGRLKSFQMQGERAGPHAIRRRHPLWPKHKLVMAGLDPAIHVFRLRLARNRGCPAQGRA
jgi:clan AA aspartic protease (TIGR02281 family)